MGELKNLFVAAFNKASENAIFAFSTEKSDGSGWELRNTGRYAHANSFVQQSDEKAGWSLLTCEDIVDRLESINPVKGNIFLMTRK